MHIICEKVICTLSKNAYGTSWIKWTTLAMKSIYVSETLEKKEAKIGIQEPRATKNIPEYRIIVMHGITIRLENIKKLGYC